MTLFSKNYFDSSWKCANAKLDESLSAIWEQKWFFRALLPETARTCQFRLFFYRLANFVASFFFHLHLHICPEKNYDKESVPLWLKRLKAPSFPFDILNISPIQNSEIRLRSVALPCMCCCSIFRSSGALISKPAWLLSARPQRWPLKPSVAKIPSEMEVALHYILLSLFTLFALFDTVFTVYTIQTAYHCLNRSMFAYLYCYGRLERYNGHLSFWAKYWVTGWAIVKVLQNSHFFATKSEQDYQCYSILLNRRS